MKILSVSIVAAVLAVGCGTVPFSPDQPSATDNSMAAVVDASASKPAPGPRECRVMKLTLQAEPSSEYRLAYRVQAIYTTSGSNASCGGPTWSLVERDGRIISGTDPYVVHVESIQRKSVLTVVATAPNGKSATATLKF